MIHSVDITNLRGIRQGKVEALTALTVLVGPNGCGKSTILDALLIGAHPVPPEAVGRAVARRWSVRNGARWLAFRADETASIHITVRGATGAHECTIAFERPSGEEAARLRCDVSSRGQESVDVSFSAGNIYSYQRGLRYAQVVPELRFVESYEFEGAPLHQLYAAAVEQGRRQQARAIMTHVVPRLQDVEILVEGDAPIVHLVFADYSVPAALGGDGLHALLRLILELAARPRGVVLIEEPEVHQHPASAREIARAILAAVRREIQVVLTTHSLEFIDLLLAESNDDDLKNMSLHRLKLQDGELLSSRLAGPEVAFARQQIEDDLR